MRKLYSIILILPLLLGSCKDPYQNQVFMAYDGQAIGLWLESQPEYSLWVEMLRKADLFNALNLGTHAFTCFVANNTAVENYLRDNTDYSSVADMSAEEVDHLMRYHIIAGGAIASANMMLKLNIATITGDYLTAGINLQTNDKYIDNGDDKPRSTLVEKDIKLANGVVHCLDNMLQPLTKSLWDILSTDERYTLFAQAVQACGFDTYLSEVYRTVAEGASSEATIRAHKTVLVVSDEVFEVKGITSMDDLRARFTGDPANKDSAFYQWMLYHLLDRLNGYAELTDFPPGYQNMTLYGCSEIKGISVEDTGGRVIFNPQEPEKSFCIIDAHRDIPTKNGYIHEIDNLMELPNNMAHFVVVWEPTDKFEFQVIPYYRAVKGEGSPVEKFFITDLDFPGIRWESVPANKASVWYQSDFTGSGRYLYHDALYWDMGDIGWLEIDFPVLPMGLYHFYVEKSNDASYGGVCAVRFDDANMGDDRNFMNGANRGDWLQRTITSEEKHVMRFITVTGGNFGVDRFILVPKE